MAFWKMGIKQDMTYTDGLKGESIWNNPRAPVIVEPRYKRAIVYLRTTIDLELYGDITDRDTNLPRTKGEWEDRIEELHIEAFTRPPTLEHIDTMADLVISVVAQIPREIITEISKPHMVQLKEDKLVAAITDSGHLRYGRCKLTPQGLRLEEVWVDAVGLPHLTGKIRPCMNRTLHDVEVWHMGPRDDRLIGPREFIFPHMKGWTIDGEKVRMDGLHVNS